MQKTEVIKALAKGAPGATIVMSPADLDGFAKAVIDDYKMRTGDVGIKTEEPKRPRRPPRREQAEIIQAIKEVWPNANCVRLAEALGVSKMWIYKLLQVDLSDSLTNDAGLTVSDAAEVIAEIKAQSPGASSGSAEN